MSNLQFCIARRKTEVPTFTRVLKAIRQDRLDYRPDPKARTAGELASLLVTEEAALVTLLDIGSVQWKEGAPMSSVAVSRAPS